MIFFQSMVLELELPRCGENRRMWSAHCTLHTVVWNILWEHWQLSPDGAESKHWFCLCWDDMLRKVFWLFRNYWPVCRSQLLPQTRRKAFPETPAHIAYVCVHGAICGAACTCEYTSVSLQVERVHVCALVRLFTGLFVSSSCRAHLLSPSQHAATDTLPEIFSSVAAVKSSNLRINVTHLRWGEELSANGRRGWAGTMDRWSMREEGMTGQTEEEQQRRDRDKWSWSKRRDSGVGLCFCPCAA